MQTVRVLGWNIENYGLKKFDTGGDELIAFIAQVIKSKNIDIAAFCELRQDFAKEVGDRLVKKLGHGWTRFASKGFVPGRLEQYLFVWNETTVQNVKTTGINVAGNASEFRWEFHDSSKAKKRIGFRALTVDRPPLMGEFKPVSGAASIRVAMIHAPEPKYKPDPRDAARNLALVDDLRVAKTATVLLGDFNVKHSANAATGFTYGEPAFASLLTKGFAQLFAGDEQTSLSTRRTVPAKQEDYLCQPYDQIFVWADTVPSKPKTKVATHSDPKVEDVIDEVLEYVKDKTKNSDIHDALLTLMKKKKSMTPLSNVAEIFWAYRTMVSDHLPVSVSITC